MVHCKYGKVNTSQDEGVGERIHDKEVRMLYQQDRGSGERRRQYTHSPAVEPGANEVNQEDRGDVENCGGCAANDVDLVVADLFDDWAAGQIT